jgi:hypothetical protein
VTIDECPMKCIQCGHEAPLDDCDCDDPFGDGSIGCPVPDCGGLAVMDKSKVKVDEQTGMYERA